MTDKAKTSQSPPPCQKIRRAKLKNQARQIDFFPMKVSVILGSSYNADVCSSVHFFDKFGCSE